MTGKGVIKTNYPTYKKINYPKNLKKNRKMKERGGC